MDKTQALTKESFFGILALVFCSIFANGYYIGISDHHEQLPIIKHIMDPSFLENDWFVIWNSSFNVRFFYSLVMAAFSQIFGIELAFFFIYLLVLITLSTAVYLLTLSIWGNPGVSSIAVILILFSRLGSLGSSQLVYPILVPSFLAFSLALVAALWLYREQYFRGIFLLAIIGLIHPLIGLEVGILLTFAVFISTYKEQRHLRSRELILLFIVVSITAILGFIATRGSGGSVDQTEVLQVLAWMRHPWHYVPFTWEKTLWISFMSFGLLALIARINSPGSKFLDSLVLGIFALCIFGMIAFFWEPLVMTIKLQPFRMTVFLQLAGVLYLAVFIWSLLSSSSHPAHRLAGLIILVSLVLSPMMPDIFPMYLAIATAVFFICQITIKKVLLNTGLSRYQYVLPWITIIPMILPIILMASGLTPWHWTIYLISAMVSLGVLWIGLKSDATNIHVFMRLTAFTIVILIGSTLIFSAWKGNNLPPKLQQFTKKLSLHQNYSSSFSQLALWARANTPIDSVFIVPPYTNDFRLKAERAIVIDFKAFVFNDKAVIEWRDRIVDLSGGEELPLGNNWYSQLRESYMALDKEEIVQLSQKFEAYYVIVESSQTLDFSTLYSNSDFILYIVE